MVKLVELVGIIATLGSICLPLSHQESAFGVDFIPDFKLGGEKQLETLRVSRLPQPFRDDFCRSDNKRKTCFDLIGCISNHVSGGTPEKPNDIGAEFVIYTRKGRVETKYGVREQCDSSRCAKYPFNILEMEQSDFDPSKRTILVVAGYMSSSEDKWRLDIKDRWLVLEDVNVIVVSWKDGNHEAYDQAASNTRVLARLITIFFYYLAQVKNVNPLDENFLSSITLVGHSLGAHVCGFVGKDYSGRIGRITGLDPAGPRFNDEPRESKLDKTDAQLVEAIHTNGGRMLPFFGHEDPLGHIDYYANDGTNQPDCKLPLAGVCSHSRATKLYIDFLDQSISRMQNRSQSPCKFSSAFRSDSWSSFENGDGFAHFCPNTAFSASPIEQGDGNRCSVPMDFVSPFYEVRRNLESVHGVSFNPLVNPMERLYFKTGPSKPFLRRHYLMRIQYHKSIRAEHQAKNRCNINLTIAMDDGRSKEYTHENVQMYDNGQLYNIAVPKLMFDRDASDILQQLEMNNYFLAYGVDNNQYLQNYIMKLLPRYITIDLKETDRLSKGVNLPLVGFVMNKVKKRMSLNHMHQNMSSLTLQALDASGRVLMAIYTVGNEFARPKLFVYNERTQLALPNLWESFKRSQMKYLNSVKLSLDSVYIGTTPQNVETGAYSMAPMYQQQFTQPNMMNTIGGSAYQFASQPMMAY